MGFDTRRYALVHGFFFKLFIMGPKEFTSFKYIDLYMA